MRRPVTALAVLFASGFALVGCGGGNPESLPEFHGGAGATSSVSAGQGTVGVPEVAAAATPPSAEVTYTPADAWGEGAWVERGKIVAHSAAQKAAVEAVTKYMSVRVELSNTWQVDQTALNAVASGEAVTSAEQRAASQRAAGQRSIGRFVIDVSSVHITGSTALVTGCHFDGTSEVDAHGSVLVPPPGGVRITMTVRRTGNTWRVVSWPTTPAPVCDWRK